MQFKKVKQRAWYSSWWRKCWAKKQTNKTLASCLFLFSVLPLLHDSPSKYSIPLNIILSYGSSSYAGIRQLSDKARCWLLEKEANSQGKGGGAWHVSHRLRGGSLSKSFAYLNCCTLSVSLLPFRHTIMILFCVFLFLFIILLFSEEVLPLDWLILFLLFDREPFYNKDQHVKYT